MRVIARSGYSADAGRTPVTGASAKARETMARPMMVEDVLFLIAEPPHFFFS
jgi:hypothetical protein